MRRGLLLKRLGEHQEEILTIIQGGERMLNDPARDTAALARARWALMRALTAYQLFKHREIFDPTIERALFGEPKRAARMKHACVAMGEEFRSYLTKWSASDVPGNWAAYHPAALTIIARLRRHIATERDEITALLEPA